jgi:DNA repair exonuclease SbcCD nuclease subunit
VKIGVTADIHLTSREKNPERFQALENILEQMAAQGAQTLVIAGDLFDATCTNPGVLETLLRNERYAQVQLYIIPGNHDPALPQGAFTQQNIHYLAEPRLVELARGANFLFLPYQQGASVGEALAAFPRKLAPDGWVLVAHGDYLASRRLRNTYEVGLYMPLSGSDLALYQPKKVFLGHIHASMDGAAVHYPGSPCGLDPSETGARSFLLYDSESGGVDRIPVENALIYMQETLTVIPTDNEAGTLQQALSARLAAWDLDEAQKKNVRARVRLQGYAGNREQLARAVQEALKQHGVKLQEPPDLSRVMVSTDVMRADIATAVQERLLGMTLADDPDEPSRDAYILAAMQQIYRG